MNDISRNTNYVPGMPMTPEGQDWDVFDAAPKESRDFLNYAPTKLTITMPWPIPLNQIMHYYLRHRIDTLRLYGSDYPEDFTILDDPTGEP